MLIDDDDIVEREGEDGSGDEKFIEGGLEQKTEKKRKFALIIRNTFTSKKKTDKKAAAAF